MKMTVSTSVLQDVIARAMKGASCNKNIPITEMVCVSLHEDVLTTITTDSVNFLYIKQNAVPGEDFYVVAKAEILSKLVSKMTSPEITLTVDGEKLLVKGNGSYSMELPLDEEGCLVSYPDPEATPFISVEETEWPKSCVDLMLKTSKASLSTDSSVPCYTGYYIGEQVVTTDSFTMCGVDSKLLGAPALVSPETVELLGLMVNERISVKKSTTDIVFSTPTVTVYSKLMPDVASYNYEAVSGLLANDMPYYVSINKQTLAQLVDRIALFVGPYDKGEITLSFSNSGLMVSSKDTGSTEKIEYKEKGEFAESVCHINVQMLQKQIKAYSGDILKVEFGNGSVIKFIDGNVIQLIALME